MRVNVLFFGQLKDVVGRNSEELDIEDGTALQTLFEHYAEGFPRFRQLAPSIVMAINQQFARPDEVVHENDEVAFLPPVSGGAPESYTHQITEDSGHFYALTRRPIDLDSLKTQVLQSSDGAFIIFEGVVRDNTKGRPTLFLDYECYEAMAIRVLREVGQSIAQSHAIGKIAMVHRLGRMQIGETSVAIVVAAPHRKPAFEAALEGINRLKKMVPIWKKEHFADGEVWVDGEWDESLQTPSEPSSPHP